MKHVKGLYRPISDKEIDKRRLHARFILNARNLKEEEKMIGLYKKDCIREDNRTGQMFV